MRHISINFWIEEKNYKKCEFIKNCLAATLHTMCGVEPKYIDFYEYDANEPADDEIPF